MRSLSKIRGVIVGFSFVVGLIAGLMVFFVLSLQVYSFAGEVPESVRLAVEARELIKEYGNQVWPGFGDNPPPYAVQTGEMTYLVGHPSPPDGFSKGSTDPETYVKEGSVIDRPVATSLSVGGEYTVVVSTRELLGRFARKQLGDEGFELDRKDYVQALAHEGFHAFQLVSLGGLAGLPTFGFSGDPAEIQNSLRESETWDRRSTQIGRALVRAEGIESLTEKREALENYTAIEDDEHPLSVDVSKFETQIEWLEGTARYAGTKTLFMASRNRRDSPVDYGPAEAVISGLLEGASSGPSGPTPVRDQLAAVGAVKGILLDGLFPGWKEVLFREKKSLEELLTSSVNVPESLLGFPVTGVWLNEEYLAVGLADNQARWSHGLQRVGSLDALDGMVFLFPAAVHSGFWMKDTEMSLQIGFFSESGELAESVVMDPCRTDDCPVHVPEEPFKYVLELPAASRIQLTELDGGVLEIPEELA